MIARTVSFAAIAAVAFAAAGAPSPGARAAELPPDIAERHLAGDDCDEPGADEFMEPRAYDLGDGNTLWIVPCILAAYNAIDRVYVVDSFDETRQLFFADFDDRLGWSGSDYVLNAGYDPEARTLSTLALGRGLGDCGSAAVYEWADYGFRMLEYRYWGECDGTRPGPDNWPVIYPAE